MMLAGTELKSRKLLLLIDNQTPFSILEVILDLHKKMP